MVCSYKHTYAVYVVLKKTQNMSHQGYQSSAYVGST
jgi:hypothetical protein